VTRATLILVALTVGLFASGCGGADEPAPRGADATPDAGPPLVAGLERTTRVVDRDTLAADALDTQALARLLASAGYNIGLEEEYTGRTKLYAHVVARRLEFNRTDGAARYIAWLRTNAADLLGTAKRAAAVDIGADGFLTRDAGCGCHSDLPTYLAAWREGSIVHTLLADGPGVDRERFLTLAREVA
jgi:hypothetical protein